MKPTTEYLQRYIGGQLEIRNTLEGYLYRGEVENVSFTGEDLIVRFKWLARFVNDLWRAHDNLDYAASRELANFSEIGENRLNFQLMFVGESCTFFPPDGSRLDPRIVNGLSTQTS